MNRRLKPLPVPSSRTVRIVWTIVAALIIIGGIALTAYVVDSRQISQADRADLRATLTETRADLDAEEAASTALADQVESLGEEPVVEPRQNGTPSTLVPIPGPRGPAVSFGVLMRAVAQQLGDALADSCDGTCEGAPGAGGTDGADGADGADSTAPGPPGAPSTVPGPRGPAGESIKGDPGTNGTDGRGITDAQCGDDGRWTITYTDTTTSDGGACRADLLPLP